MTNGKVSLKDVFDVVNRLEDKMDRRLCSVEEKVNGLEAFKDNLTGKITLLIGLVSLSFNFVFDYIRQKVGIEK